MHTEIVEWPFVGRQIWQSPQTLPDLPGSGALCRVLVPATHDKVPYLIVQTADPAHLVKRPSRPPALYNAELDSIVASFFVEGYMARKHL